MNAGSRFDPRLLEIKKPGHNVRAFLLLIIADHMVSDAGSMTEDEWPLPFDSGTAFEGFATTVAASARLMPIILP